ncbi:MAG: hypothetical protein KDC05_09320 [Bacteroidales bacterium]|nr:hypothetical protein [Bacteroidales bacterium]
MNILIQIREQSADREIREFTEADGNQVFISHSTAESIGYLSAEMIDQAVISLKHINDAAILKYLSEYYPDIKIVVIADKKVTDILSLFQQVEFTVIHEPLRLSDLKKQLEKKLTLQ